MNKSRNFIILSFLFVAITFTFFAIFSNEIIEARLNSLSYLRQLNASFSLSQVNPLKWLGFWHWNTKPIQSFTDSGIFLSYPIISYIPNTIIAFITRDIEKYQELTLLIGIFQLLSISYITYDLFLSSNFKKNGFSNISVQFFSIIAAVLFLTNPATLGLLIEPDFEDCFIFLSFLGFWSHFRFKNKTLSKIIFFISSFSYPTGSLIILIGFILINLINSNKIKLSQNKSDNLKQRIAKFTSSIEISIWPFLIGFIFYILLRIFAYYLIDNAGIQTTGSSLLFRVGLDPSDTYYGGILSTLKFLTPIVNIPKEILDINLNNLDLKSFWLIVNCLLLLLEFIIFNSIGIIYLIRVISNSSEMQKKNIEILGGYFILLAFTYILLFPQWSAVHFRLIARFIAPSSSIGLSIFLMKINNRISLPRGRYLSWEMIFLSWILIIDQLRYFLTWNI